MGNLLYLVAVVLVIIFLVGLLVPGMNSFGMGNLIYGLVVIAIIMVLLRIISGRRPV